MEGGNWKVCEGLLERSKTIINKKTQIIEIIKKTTPDREQPSYYLRSDKGLISTHFDVVIVAVPLEIKHNFIGCDGCSRWPHQQQLGEFQQTVATFLKGKINENTFKFCSELPCTIGTMEKPEICFSSVGKQTSVWNKKLHGQEQVWKVFSREPLTKECTEKLFSRRDDAKSVVWLAYPHYTPPEKFLPFVLDEGIFYVNAIEWAASAMEMSALSGKNAALLAAQFLKKGKSLTSKHQEGHEEL